jgi:hypothetical protein
VQLRDEDETGELIYLVELLDRACKIKSMDAMGSPLMLNCVVLGVVFLFSFVTAV